MHPEHDGITGKWEGRGKTWLQGVGHWDVPLGPSLPVSSLSFLAAVV